MLLSEVYLLFFYKFEFVNFYMIYNSILSHKILTYLYDILLVAYFDYMYYKPFML